MSPAPCTTCQPLSSPQKSRKKAFHQQSSTAYLKEKTHYSEKAPQTRGQEEGWAQLPSPAPPGADPESSWEPSTAPTACGGAGTSLGAITNKVQKPPGLPPRVELEDGFLLCGTAHCRGAKSAPFPARPPCWRNAPVTGVLAVARQAALPTQTPPKTRV